MRTDNQAHWVYRCYDSADRLIYVGSTCNLVGRLAAHDAGSWWSPQVVKVKAKVYPHGETARAAEREAILNEIPRWNIQGKWRTRARWSDGDWRDYIQAVGRNANSSAVKRHLQRVKHDYSALQAAAA